MELKIEKNQSLPRQNILPFEIQTKGAKGLVTDVELVGNGSFIIYGKKPKWRKAFHSDRC